MLIVNEVEPLSENWPELIIVSEVEPELVLNIRLIVGKTWPELIIVQEVRSKVLNSFWI